MTKPVVLGAMALALLLFTASARAQDAPQPSRGVEITPFMSLGSNASSGVGAAVRWPLVSNFSVELESAVRWAEVTSFGASVSLLYDLPNLGPTTPYVAAGIGLDQYGSVVEVPGRGIGLRTTTALSVNAGGGVRVPVGDNWGVRSDARWSNGLGANAERWRLYNGVTLGRSR